ncbi:Ribonuclease H [Abeliophyllum distichum]|uniref:Ribonuclease H n=1 Tax=Abeliophyllum distichum TaxID=126358 RepID=A0ABD1UM10_9LAMI
MQSPSSPKKVQSLTERLATLNRFISKATDRCQPFFKTIKERKRFEWSEEYEKAFQELKILIGKAPLLSKTRNRKTLLVYLVVLKKIVSSVLIQEEGPTQLSVYYVSKALQDTEIRYPNMEKLTLSLIIASQKLWPYFQSHSEAGAGAEILLVSPNSHNVNYVLHLEFKTSNNATEYEAFLAGLRLALEMKARKLQIYSDSQLVIPQIENGYADTLSKLASSRDSDLMRAIPVEKLG